MLVEVSVIELRDLWCAEHERGAWAATRRVDRHGSTGCVVHDEIRPGLAVQRQGRDVDAEVLDIVGLRAEGQRADSGVRAVGADDDVEPARRARRGSRR